MLAVPIVLQINLGLDSANKGTHGSGMVVMEEDILYEFHSPLEVGGMAYMQDNQEKQPARSADREGGREKGNMGRRLYGGFS